MGKRFVFLCACLMLLLGACDSDTSKQEEMAERTVLVYIAGDNTLSSFVYDDLEEMFEGLKTVNVEKNNLLVYYDDGSNVQLVHLKKDKRGDVVKEILREYGKSRNSVGVSEMKEIFSFAFNDYVAKSYGLVLWSHGEGWLPAPGSTRWIGQDRGNNAYMNISDLGEALSVAPNMEFILFDACFMQSAEVAYELRNNAKYLVGSPAEIPGPGAPYQVVVPALFSESNAGVNIASSYYGYYNEKYNGGEYNKNNDWTAGAAISVIATERIEKTAIEASKILLEYAAKQKAEMENIADYKVSIDLKNVTCYDPLRSEKYYYDLDGMVQKLTTDESVLAEWTQVLDNAVVYYSTTDKVYSAFSGGRMISMKDTKGLSAYIPRDTYQQQNDYFHSYGWYTAAGWSNVGW